jgi:hypothetical protein
MHIIFKTFSAHHHIIHIEIIVMFEFVYTNEQKSIWLLVLRENVSKVLCMVDFVISDFPESGDIGCEGSCSFFYYSK